MVETRSGTAVEPGTPGYAEEKVVKGTGPSGATIRVRAGGPARGTRARGGFFGFTSPQLYTFVAMAHAALALPLIFNCQHAAKFMFGKAADPPDEQHCNLFKIYASGLATSTGMLLALEELARGKMLHTYTADILKLGLIAHSIASFVMMAAYPATVSVGWWAIEGLAAAATLALPASSLLLKADDRSRIWRDVQNMPNWAVGAFRGPVRRFSWLAMLYNMLTLTFPLAGVSYFFSPRYTLYHTFGYDYGASTHYMWRFIGSGALMTLLPATTMALKHKADIQRMSATPARTLNMGLMGTAVGHLLVLGPLLTKGNGGFMLPGLVATWSATLLTSMLGLAAPEITEFAEEVVEAAKRT